LKVVSNDATSPISLLNSDGDCIIASILILYFGYIYFVYDDVQIYSSHTTICSSRYTTEFVNLFYELLTNPKIQGKYTNGTHTIKNHIVYIK